MTDTDSFMFSIQTNDPFDDIQKISDSYDLSKMPEPLPDKSRKKVPGYMKDECSDRDGPYAYIRESVAPRAKCNCKVFEDANGCDEEKKGKGYKGDVLEQQFDIGRYRDTIENGTVQHAHNIKNIRSFGFKSYVSDSSKKVFNGFDDKRYILDDCIDSLPHGPPPFLLVFFNMMKHVNEPPSLLTILSCHYPQNIESNSYSLVSVLTVGLMVMMCRHNWTSKFQKSTCECRKFL